MILLAARSCPRAVSARTEAAVGFHGKRKEMDRGTKGRGGDAESGILFGGHTGEKGKLEMTKCTHDCLVGYLVVEGTTRRHGRA